MQGRQARIPNAMVEPGSSQLKMDLLNALWPLTRKHALETGTEAHVSNLRMLITEVAGRRVANSVYVGLARTTHQAFQSQPIEEQGAKKTG